MGDIFKDILKTVESNKKLLAVLVDPEKFEVDTAEKFLQKMPFLTTHVLIGGSTVANGETEACAKAIKSQTDLPVILFPGDHSQLSNAADAVLFLSLLSGRNPEFLIGQQVKAVKSLQKSQLEIIPTAYLLIDGGRECAVRKVTKTEPLSQAEPDLIAETALAGQYLGKKLIYLEAGSGAANPVSAEVIQKVKAAVDIPVVVGGGIRSKNHLSEAYSAGADMIVVGTAFEEGNFFI